MKSETSNNYTSEGKINYLVSIQYTKEKITLIMQKKEEKNNLEYKNEYEFDFFKERLKNLYNFVNIKAVKECLQKNIKEKTLKIEEIYQNIIKTKWKIVTEDKKEKFFILLLNLVEEKKLSIIFASSKGQAKIINKSIQEQLDLCWGDSYVSNFVSENKKILGDEYVFNDEKSIVFNSIFMIDDNSVEKLKIVVTENLQKLKKKFRTVLVFFDFPEIGDTIQDLITELYEHKIFIIIVTNQNIKDLKTLINYKINELDDIEYKKSVDINNIYIIKNDKEEFVKINYILLKIYAFYNQKSDKFIREYKFRNIEEKPESWLRKEKEYLYRSHYFNIALSGQSCVGKSTFINTILGEKRAFTDENKGNTYQTSYYTLKKYPIKFIDLCGNAIGTEGKENAAKIKAGYNIEINNIIVDEVDNEIFSYEKDNRNKTHLLLYLLPYEGAKDIELGDVETLKKTKDLGIMIIFVVNKSPDDVFKKKKAKEIRLKKYKQNYEKYGFTGYSTIFINTFSKKGLEDLFNEIYNFTCINLIPKEIMDKLKTKTISDEELNNILDKSIFFNQKEHKDYMLNEYLINSVNDISQMLIEVGGYYLGKLKFSKKIKYVFTKNLYEFFHHAYNSDFYPTLTLLVEKIYKNFNRPKTYKECNLYIRKTIKDYFRIKEEEEKENKDKENNDKENKDKENNDKENNDKEKNNKENKDKENKENKDKENKDKEKNNKENKNKEKNNKENKNKEINDKENKENKNNKDKENKENKNNKDKENNDKENKENKDKEINDKENKENKENKDKEKNKENKENNENKGDNTENHLPQKDSDPAPINKKNEDNSKCSPAPLDELDLFGYGMPRFEEETPEPENENDNGRKSVRSQKSNDEKNVENKELNGQNIELNRQNLEINEEYYEELFRNLEDVQVEFNPDQFREDYFLLLSLFFNIKFNYGIEKDYYKDFINDSIEESEFQNLFFKEKDGKEKKKLDGEKIRNFVKKDLGMKIYDEKTDEDRATLKLFYISLVCNQIIIDLCEQLRKEKNDQKFYTSICHFYFTVLNSYNQAINGFLEIAKEVKNDIEVEENFKKKMEE